MPKNNKHLCCTYWCVDQKDKPFLQYHNQKTNPIYNYLCYSYEICPKTKKPHYQTYIQLKKEMKYNDIKEIIGKSKKAKFFVQRGTNMQAINYTEKFLPGGLIINPTWEEHGKMVEQGQRTDLDQVRIDIENGKSQKEIAKDDFGLWCRNYKAFAHYASMVEKHEERKCVIEVIYGKPGTGKSTLALKRYPNAYFKALDHQFWDGYTGQNEIIIDEFRPGSMPISKLLALVSPAPHQLNIKGLTTWCKATKILIISNYHPKDWYPDADKVSIAALQKRIVSIDQAKTQFVNAGDWVKEGSL